MAQALDTATPEIATGSDLVAAFQRGFELEQFVFDQHLVVNTAEQAATEAVGGFEAVEEIPEDDFAGLAGQSLAAHIERARLRAAQVELGKLNAAVGEQVGGRKLEVVSLSDDPKPIRQYYLNMQTGRREPSEGIIGLTGIFPLVSRVNPGRVKGSIVTADLSSNRLMIKPRKLTAHGTFGDRWQASMIGEGGEPLVEVNFLD